MFFLSLGFFRFWNENSRWLFKTIASDEKKIQSNFKNVFCHPKLKLVLYVFFFFNYFFSSFTVRKNSKKRCWEHKARLFFMNWILSCVMKNCDRWSIVSYRKSERLTSRYVNETLCHFFRWFRWWWIIHFFLMMITSIVWNFSFQNDFHFEY